mgnify:CR=1 FL=1
MIHLEFTVNTGPDRTPRQSQQMCKDLLEINWNFEVEIINKRDLSYYQQEPNNMPHFLKLVTIPKLAHVLHYIMVLSHQVSKKSVLILMNSN